MDCLFSLIRGKGHDRRDMRNPRFIKSPNEGSDRDECYQALFEVTLSGFWLDFIQQICRKIEACALHSQQYIHSLACFNHCEQILSPAVFAVRLLPKAS